MPSNESPIRGLLAAAGGLITAWAVDVFMAPYLPQPHLMWVTVLAAVVVIYVVHRLATLRKEPSETLPESTRPTYVLDSSTLIDGRIADVVALGFLFGQYVVPPFVVAEMQGIADSSNKQRRVRGRRGLDVIERLRSLPGAQVVVDTVEPPEWAAEPVDRKLVLLSQRLGAKLVTHDFNLNKVAKAHGLEVVNLNELAQVLRPPCLPGERLTLMLVRPGEQSGQGVGHLDDGTMVVVEGGRDHLGRNVAVVVTGVTQTSGGRMVFSRFDQEVDEARPPV